MAQATFGKIVRSDWLRRCDCQSLLSHNPPVRITGCHAIRMLSKNTI